MAYQQEYKKYSNVNLSKLKGERMPDIGVGCPNKDCGGFIESKNFTNPNTKKYTVTVVCERCDTRWWWSQFDNDDDLGGAKPQNKPQDTASQIILEEVQAGFKELNERLDDLGKFLSKN